MRGKKGGERTVDCRGYRSGKLNIEHNEIYRCGTSICVENLGKKGFSREWGGVAEKMRPWKMERMKMRVCKDPRLSTRGRESAPSEGKSLNAAEG